MIISITSFINRHPVALFCALTILLTFATYLLPLPREVLPFVMVLLPALVAIVLVAITEGKPGVRALIGMLGRWRISLKWVAIALILALGLRLAMSVAALLLGLIPAIQVRSASAAQLVILAVIFVISAIPEELGWRGYALPRLLRQHSALWAGLVIGVLWGVLHLAVSLPGMMNEGQPILATMLGLTGLSVLITWLFVNTQGSVVLTTLFHAAQSFFGIVNEGIPITQQAWLMAGVYVAVAVVIVIMAGSGLTRTRSAVPADVCTEPNVMSG